MPATCAYTWELSTMILSPTAPPELGWSSGCTLHRILVVLTVWNDSLHLSLTRLSGTHEIVTGFEGIGCNRWPQSIWALAGLQGQGLVPVWDQQFIIEINSVGRKQRRIITYSPWPLFSTALRSKQISQTESFSIGMQWIRAPRWTLRPPYLCHLNAAYMMG